MILACRRQPFTCFGVIEPHGREPVAAELHTERALGMPIVKVTESPVGDASSCGDALLGLLELIAVNGIVEEVGEVRKQIQVVMENERCGPK